MGEATNTKNLKQDINTDMQVPMAELRTWCAVWSMRFAKLEWEAQLRRLLAESEAAHDGFPERPYEFAWETPEDGGEGYFFLTVASHHEGEFHFFVNPDLSLRCVAFATIGNAVILHGDYLALLTQVWGWLQQTENITRPDAA